mmetsp:Transcript_12190/g.23129  ORF Transcript_12190/g.23129 Transcript_12190/m.23129 type:complete len:279 (+) Transcript_12190:839-1675(+)|eukprot:CAMPEP_0204906270 /NCGR_PEP_ID=MMETSP1397-20131031/5889_1 /ASSEMBLY_ACC=CAM_ASM_000891 /TAXON_ID=49980 /ORGANISM="Climacostomum Climacostomum virens, Strain Stock W-24" /LENGTH=278 /DNA_ID=CAMNT_0052075257 /DNA_START=794 /DNA_END=1630 /DNA_ORIENTATION=-
MCIAGLSLNSHPRFPFILLFNRDESFHRPTQSLAWWTTHPQSVLGGQDLRGGGTWLGINRIGVFSALTIFWEEDADELQRQCAGFSAPLGADSGEYRTRGAVPLEVVKSEKSLENTLSGLRQMLPYFKSFNIFAGNAHTRQAYYLSHSTLNPTQFQELEPGVHCLSNGLLDAPKPKVQLLKTKLKDWLTTREDFEPEELFEVMEDTSLVVEEGQDPNDNIFVKTYTENIVGRDEPYGTTSTAIIAVTPDNHVIFLEKSWDEAQQSFTLAREEFVIESR